MSGVKGWIAVTPDCRVLCNVFGTLDLLPIGPDLCIHTVCFCWKDTLEEFMKMWLHNIFTGDISSINFDLETANLELVEAEIDPALGKLYIL